MEAAASNLHADWRRCGPGGRKVGLEACHRPTFIRGPLRGAAVAGNLLKSLGAFFLVFGILGVLGGGAAAAYGLSIQQENNDRLVPSQDAQDASESLLLGGALAAGIGLLLVLVSIFLFVGGGARAQQALREEVRRSASASPPAAAPAHSAAPARPPAPPVPTPGPAPIGTKLFALVAILLFVGLLLMFALVGIPGGPASSFADRDEPRGVASWRWVGEVENTLMTGGGSTGTTSARNVLEYTVPPAGHRVELNLTWEVGTAGSPQMDFIVQDASGRELGRVQGSSPLRLSVGEAAGTLTILVYPEGAGFVVSQPFVVVGDVWTW